jgi:hypothetical protein
MKITRRKQLEKGSHYVDIGSLDYIDPGLVVVEFIDFYKEGDWKKYQVPELYPWYEGYAEVGQPIGKIIYSTFPKKFHGHTPGQFYPLRLKYLIPITGEGRHEIVKRLF